MGDYSVRNTILCIIEIKKIDFLIKNSTLDY